jgi:hypothetical protein
MLRPATWPLLLWSQVWTEICKSLTLSLLMSHICGVSKMFGEWYQKTNKTEDTNKLTLLAFKIIIILHYTRLATFIKLLETVSKGLFRNRSQNMSHVVGLPPYGIIIIVLHIYIYIYIHSKTCLKRTLY